MCELYEQFKKSDFRFCFKFFAARRQVKIPVPGMQKSTHTTVKIFLITKQIMEIIALPYLEVFL